MAHELAPLRRVTVGVRNGRLLVDVDYVVDELRVRAQHYRDRADGLIAAATDPANPVEAEEGDPVPIVEEALACRMVAEELEQRADQFARILGVPLPRCPD